MKQIYIFVLLFLILISVFCIFSARHILYNRVEKSNENKAVKGMKVFFLIVLIASLTGLYLLK